jgi:hypothetical protein
MTDKQYPRGWNEARIRRVLDYYEAQSDEEAAAEITAALESTTMEVPVALVPTVRELIAKRKSQRTSRTKTPNPSQGSGVKRADGGIRRRRSGRLKNT